MMIYLDFITFFILFCLQSFVSAASNSYIWTVDTFDGYAFEAIATDQDGSFAVAIATYYSTLGSGGVFIYNNGYWVQASSSTFGPFCTASAVSVDSSGTYIVVGSLSDGIYHSTDAGSTWVLSTNTGNFVTNYLACSSSGSIVAAADNGGCVYMSYNYGSTWSQNLYLGSSYTVNGVAVSSSGTYVYATVIYSSSLGYLYGSSNSGQSGTYFQLDSSNTLPTNIEYLYVVCDSSGQYVVVDGFFSDGYVFYSSNYGQYFIPSSASIIYANDMSMSLNGQTLSIISNFDYFYQSYDGGTTYTELYYSNGNFLSGISTSATADVVFMTSTNGDLYIGTISTSSSLNPTFSPSIAPSKKPTELPSLRPTQPTSEPTSRPSNPSTTPTSSPSANPSGNPSSSPSKQPITHPSSQPTNCPTSGPSNPTSTPTMKPTSLPTARPSSIPPCPAGTHFEFIPGGFLCVPCPPGYFSLNQSSTCTECSAGSFAYNNGSSSCTLCPSGYYSGSSRATGCNKCPPGTVTGGTGSTAKSACVNPSVNFILGFISFGLCGLVIAVYLCCGRLQRIAFQRKFFLIRKSIMAYDVAIQNADFTSTSSRIIASVVAVKRRIMEEGSSWSAIKKYAKPALFVVTAGVVMFTVITVSFLYAIALIVFNAMVIFRGYRLYINLDFSFLDRLQLFFVHLDIALKLPNFHVLAYPLIYIANALAHININLNTLNVTCNGAQAPFYLLVDCIIVGIIIIIIESDVQVFWALSFSKLMDNVRGMLFNRYYVSKNPRKAIAFAGWSTLLSLLPQPRKVIQYCLGFISIGLFFTEDGHSQSNVNCDAALGFPIDSMLAVLTTIFAIFMLSPLIYVFAEVLVPRFERVFASKIVKQAMGVTEDEVITVQGIAVNQPMKKDAKIAEVVQEVHSNSPLAKVKEPIDWNERVTLVMEDLEGNGSFGKQCVRFWTLLLKISSAILSFDWFYMKAIYIFACRLLLHLQQFSKDAHERSVDILNDTFAELEKHKDSAEYVDNTRWVKLQFQNFSDMYDEGADIISAETKPLPWFHLFQRFSKDEVKKEEVLIEKRMWAYKRQLFPTYYSMVCDTYEDLLKIQYSCSSNQAENSSSSFNSIRRFSARLFCWSLPHQVYGSAEGRSHWIRVFENYIVFCMTSLGLWNTFVLRNFNILKEYEEFLMFTANGYDEREGLLQYEHILKETLRQERIHKRQRNHREADEDELSSYGSTHSSKDLERGFNLFKKQMPQELEDNNRKQRFAIYVAATISSRAVLLQLIPPLTIWSIFAVEVSDCPIFVFCESVRERLPPLLIKNPYDWARSILKIDHPNTDPPMWKIRCMVPYIVLKQSRLVRFLIAFSKVLTAVGVVFFPRKIQGLITFIVIVLLITAIIEALNILPQLYKFIFPEEFMGASMAVGGTSAVSNPLSGAADSGGEGGSPAGDNDGSGSKGFEMNSINAAKILKGDFSGSEEQEDNDEDEAGAGGEQYQKDRAKVDQHQSNVKSAAAPASIQKPNARNASTSETVSNKNDPNTTDISDEENKDDENADY